MAGKESLNRTFETALEQLEQIVEQLESGELSLEDSLAWAWSKTAIKN